MKRDKVTKVRAQVKSRWYYLFWGAATLSVLALVVVSLFTPAPKNEDLNQFFDETN